MPEIKHKAACVLAQNAAGNYLLQFRDSGGGHTNPLNVLKWGFFGGHYEEEEKPVAAAVREFCEETDVLVSEDELSYLGQGVFNGTEVTLFLLKRPIEWDEIVLREGAGMGFFTREELDLLPLIESAQKLIAELL